MAPPTRLVGVVLSRRVGALVAVVAVMGPAAVGRAAPPHVVALTASTTPTPALPGLYVRVRGGYPVFSSRGRRLAALNAAIRRAVVTDERSIAGPRQKG